MNTPSGTEYATGQTTIALIARGSLTFWFDENAVAAWRNADPHKGPGAPKVYSDTAIQCSLVLKSVFQLSLRWTQGFVSSLLELLRLGLPVPDYSTISRTEALSNSTIAPVASVVTSSVEVAISIILVWGQIE